MHTCTHIPFTHTTYTCMCMHVCAYTAHSVICIYIGCTVGANSIHYSTNNVAISDYAIFLAFFIMISWVFLFFFCFFMPDLIFLLFSCLHDYAISPAFTGNNDRVCKFHLLYSILQTMLLSVIIVMIRLLFYADTFNSLFYKYFSKLHF